MGLAYSFSQLRSGSDFDSRFYGFPAYCGETCVDFANSDSGNKRERLHTSRGQQCMQDRSALNKTLPQGLGKLNRNYTSWTEQETKRVRKLLRHQSLNWEGECSLGNCAHCAVYGLLKTLD